MAVPACDASDQGEWTSELYRVNLDCFWSHCALDGVLAGSTVRCWSMNAATYGPVALVVLPISCRDHGSAREIDRCPSFLKRWSTVRPSTSTTCLCSCTCRDAEKWSIVRRCCCQSQLSRVIGLLSDSGQRHAGDLVSEGTIHDHRRSRVALVPLSSPRRSNYRHAVVDKVTDPETVVASSRRGED